MQDRGRRRWLVYNGEIYNFREIRTVLESLGHSFSSNCDTEVLLKAYGEWGAACLERLRGMFAFALWDAEQERLFLARDRFGVKPLYYYQSSDQFVFGSEVRALLATNLIPRRVERDSLGPYLEFGSVQDPMTLVEGIKSLPAGHFLVWEKGGLVDQIYWDIAEVAGRPPATDSFEEAIGNIHEILSEAVSLRLVSDVPLGVFLSGGMDSTSIATLAQESNSRPIETFSVVFNDARYSEDEYSSFVAKRLNSHHHRVTLREQDVLARLDMAMESMDQPSIDGLNTYVVSEATRAEGATVALSGVGGDELFAGYPTFRAVPKLMAFRTSLGWTSPVLKRWASPLESHRLAKLLGAATESTHPYFILRRLFTPRGVDALLQDDAKANHNGTSAPGPGKLCSSLSLLDAVNQVSVLEASNYMLNTLLRDADVMSMAHSLEVRTPLLDHELWEYVLPLAGRLKLNSGCPKPLLLKALGARIPEQIYARPKMGFALPFDEWSRGVLRTHIEQELLNHQASGRGPINTKAASTVWNHFLSGKTNWARPWSLFVLKQWIRRHLEG
jgi:asparagine synthase (glutamine-hydrolysing)